MTITCPSCKGVQGTDFHAIVGVRKMPFDQHHGGKCLAFACNCGPEFSIDPKKLPGPPPRFSRAVVPKWLEEVPWESPDLKPGFSDRLNAQLANA